MQHSYIELLRQFIQRILVVNSNGMHKLDGILALKVVIALMENLPGGIDAILPQFVGILLAELHQSQAQKAPQNYTLMLIQALCSTLFNNCPLALHSIDTEGQTIPFFTALMKFMPKFKKEFEIRRVLFGLTAIMRSAQEHLPPLVAQKRPDLMKEVASLTVKCYQDRTDTLKENEDYLAKGMPDLDGEDGEYDSESDDEKEMKDLKEDGWKKAGQFFGEDGSDDDDDSDYEVEGDDNGLYDSNLDDVDELLYLKETVDAIHASDSAFFTHLTSLIAPDNLNKFAEALNNA